MPQLILARDWKYQKLLTHAAARPHYLSFLALACYCERKAVLEASQRRYTTALVYRMEAQDWANAYSNWGLAV